MLLEPIGAPKVWAWTSSRGEVGRIALMAANFFYLNHYQGQPPLG